MRTDMECTPTNYGKSSIRILNKGPDYFRSTSVNSQNSDGKKKTAAERLEADKLKYVKSAKARQLQKLSNLSPNTQNNDSTGSQSMGTASTGSPMNIEDDDSDFTNNTSPESYRPSPIRSTQIQSSPSNGLHRKVITRANTNADTRSRDRFRQKQRNRSASEQFSSGYVVTSKSGETAVNQLRINRSKPSKNSPLKPVAKSPEQLNSNKPKPVKTFSTYLNKAKEGIKAVTSNIAGVNTVDEIPDTPKGRQSRSTRTRTSKYRSSSVGASVLQKREQASQPSVNVNDIKNGAESPTMSPRTHLKHVRQNLKKVNSSPSALTRQTDENKNTKYVSPAHRPKGKTFTINPKQVDQNTFIRAKNTSRDNSNMPRALRGRPLSVIENRSANSLAESLKSNQSLSEQRLRRRSSSSGKFIETDGNAIDFSESLNSRNLCVENQLKIQAQNLKRRSWDLSNTMDNSLQLPLSKPVSLTPDPDSMLTSSLTQTPRQRKSWSRVPQSTSEYRKSQEFSHNRPGLRKSITEALEEIFTPLVDDDMDTAYNSMSPDASMECKTLVNQEKDNDDSEHRMSKSPDSGRTPTGSQSANSSGGNDVDISKTLENTQRQLYPEERLWSTYRNNLAAQSQPLNRIDLAPNTNSLPNSHSSPLLAPKSRREVAPDYTSRNATNSLSRSTREERLDTLRSQNTSSSASVDASKPFTALTASDLKPRRTKRNMVAQVAPIKPINPYTIQPHNLRMNSKRHNNAPISPTLSPHKQAARMGSHGSRSSSSTPYSSLKRTPTSSRSSSLKKNRQRSKSDVSLFQFELDRFFSSMGMEECLISPLPALNDTLFTTAHVSSESDFSFAGASAYVRDSPDEALPMEVDPMTAGLAHVPAVSIIEKNARVMRWLMTCKKSGIPASPSLHKPPGSPRIPVSIPYAERESNQGSNPHSPLKNTNKNRNYEVVIDKRQHSGYSRKPSSPRVQTRSHMSPPPVPPRLHSYQPNTLTTGHPKESDV